MQESKQIPQEILGIPTGFGDFGSVKKLEIPKIPRDFPFGNSQSTWIQCKLLSVFQVQTLYMVYQAYHQHNCSIKWSQKLVFACWICDGSVYVTARFFTKTFVMYRNYLSDCQQCQLSWYVHFERTKCCSAKFFTIMQFLDSQSHIAFRTLYHLSSFYILFH